MKSLDENLYKTAQNRQSVPFAWHKIKTIQRVIRGRFSDQFVPMSYNIEGKIEKSG